MLKPNFVTKKEIDGNYAKFEITPLPGGFGHSLGNALRRVLLSSIEGSAITYVKINDSVHAFSTIDGVKESVLDIILNLKGLRFRTTGKGPFKMKLEVKGKNIVTGAQFEGGDVEVVNKDAYIAEITAASTKLDVEVTVEQGYGYSTAEEKEEKAFGTLALDSVFSPVTKVMYKVENERVGRKSNFDKLVLEIWTDGSIDPEKALHQSAETLSTYFAYILSGNDMAEAGQASMPVSTETGTTVDPKVYDIIIDELDLPTRVINALLREKIETVGDLVERGQEALNNLKGVGRKSVSLIEVELEKLGVKLELK
jgi:DNA-directed RNA polymerase subunit alpha